MKKNRNKNRGFSLLEIMVVVAIIGIMAGSVSIGFNSFGQTIRLRETSGVITDRIKAMELETIRRDYRKDIINFEENFLVVESEVGDQTLELSWKGVGGGCPPDYGELEINNPGPDLVFLDQRDEYGNNINKFDYNPGISKYCVNFKDSDETEWLYQLSQGSEASQAIRFIHFNIRRDSGNELPKITAGNDYTLEISAPYSKKEFYKSGVKELGTVELTLELEEDGEKVIVTLQK